MGAKLTTNKINEMVRKKNSKISIIHESYVNRMTSCKWIHEDFGEFEMRVCSVFRGGSHPLEKKEKREQECLLKYGVKNPMQSKEVRDKIKATNLDRYGVESALQSKEVRDKIKATNLDRYGVENIFQNKDAKAKIKQTNLDRYGVENVKQNESIKEKARKTCLKNHGVEYPTQSKAVRDKGSKNSLIKYGVEHTLQNENIKQRIKATNLEKYGTEYPGQNTEVKIKIQNTNLERYGNKCSAHGEEVRKKIRVTNLERYGVGHPMQNKEVRDKIKATNLERYGTENAMQNIDIKSQSFATRTSNGSIYRSVGEIEILDFVKSLGLNAHTSNIRGISSETGDKRIFSLDILVPEKKIAIEFNGLYWHNEATKKRYPKYHLDKTNACLANDLSLIHIWEHEWTEKKNVVKSYLSSRLGVNSIKIPARKCEIKMIDKKQANSLLVSWHLLGKPQNSHKAIALFFEGEVVSIATYGKHHRKNDCYVLSRFASKPGINVVGGLGRLSSKISKLVGDDLISWVELRLSSPKSYLLSGWFFDGALPIDYFYFDKKNGGAASKQSRKKSRVKTPIGVTEKDHAVQDGLFRVFDCGKARIRFKKKIT